MAAPSCPELNVFKSVPMYEDQIYIWARVDNPSCLSPKWLVMVPQIQISELYNSKYGISIQGKVYCERCVFML